LVRRLSASREYARNSMGRQPEPRLLAIEADPMRAG
jgi:hypothetical protein